MTQRPLPLLGEQEEPAEAADAIEDMPWEGMRFHRGPDRGLELVLNRWEPIYFHVIVDFLTGGIRGPLHEGRRLLLLSPFLAAHVHFVGREYLYHRLHHVYHFQAPPRSRAFLIAEHWVWEAEREIERRMERHAANEGYGDW